MAKLKLTKNELKKQKDMLKVYRRYLPTLQLKKQQLQAEIQDVREKAERVLAELRVLEEELENWIALYGEAFPFEEVLSIKHLVTGRGNVAGVDMPVFEKVEFAAAPYDLFETPFWVDDGIRALEQTISLRLQHRIYEEQKRLLEYELRVTTQRVNLFEKVKIPETIANVKKIQIYMNDMQTAAVVCGKIAKKKLEESQAQNDWKEVV